jgi:hypothetical protein
MIDQHIEQAFHEARPRLGDTLPQCLSWRGPWQDSWDCYLPPLSATSLHRESADVPERKVRCSGRNRRSETFFPAIGVRSYGRHRIRAYFEKQIHGGSQTMPRTERTVPGRNKSPFPSHFFPRLARVRTERTERTESGPSFWVLTSQGLRPLISEEIVPFLEIVLEN